MPKKDTAAAVLGMLSTAGAQTRRAPESSEPVEERSAPPTVTVTQQVPASVSTLPTPARPVTAAAVEAPRTLRLRPATAQRLTARFGRGVLLSVLIAVAQAWGGLVLAFYTDWPVSFWITALGALAYVAAHLGQGRWRSSHP